ncbi:MAG: protein kinase [Candidatus Eiseniibacteriota bacterium]|jgi:serine/threonine-protein kinase
MIGQSIAHYRISERIGAGGMGEVYRASDTRLKRDVALKVLPEAFASDQERMQRFGREAQLLASLNHPNIAAIYGVEEANGTRCLVLELVPGEDLAQRLERGPLPLDEALEIARQVAEALESAHERGIVHRDLKPANIKVADDGTVKVLDFGLAKALEDEPGQTSDPTHSPTLSIVATRAGVILGTAAYMSPEQAKGKTVDRRADIWAFGVVLYEMLTGTRLFTGDSPSEILAAVIMQEPDLGELPDAVPPRVRQLVARCLRKDPRARLRDIGDARIALEETLAGEPDVTITSGVDAAGGGRPHASSARTTRRFQPLVLAAAALVIAVVAAALSWQLHPAVPGPPLRKFILPSMDPDGRVSGLSLAVSPGGRMIAFTANDRLWVRDLDRLEPRVLDDTDGARAPFWSPDDAWIGYGTQGRLWKVPVSGGKPTALCELEEAFNSASGGAWGEDGRIVFCTGDGGLLAVSEQGGDPASIHVPDPESELDFHNVSALPDGRGHLFVVHRREGYDTIAVLADGERRQVIRHEGQEVSHPVYTRPGYILYDRWPLNNGIWALPFALDRLEATGEPFLVCAADDSPSVARDGTLAYRRRGNVATMRQLVEVDRDGRQVRTIGQPQEAMFLQPSLSPDGRRVAVCSRSDEELDVWLEDVERGTSTRLTFESGSEVWPGWHAGGEYVIYQIGTTPDQHQIAACRADGTDEPFTIVQGSAPLPTRDPSQLFVHRRGDGWDLWRVELDHDLAPVGEAVLFIGGAGHQTAARLAPDGRHVVYQSDETGMTQVYVTGFPEAHGKWQVSVHGGQWPCWSGDGEQIFYVVDDAVMVVDVDTSAGIVLGQPEVLFTRTTTGASFAYDWIDGFDVSDDGQRFYMVRNVEPDAADDGPSQKAGIVLVENWFAEFARR